MKKLLFVLLWYAGAWKVKLELAARGINVNITWKEPLEEGDREQRIQAAENFIGLRGAALAILPPDRFLQ